MATISGTINHAITLGTGGAYALPLTITATGRISNNGSGDAIYGPGTAVWTVDNEGIVTATGAYDGINLLNGGSLVNGSSNAAALILGGTGSADGNGRSGANWGGGGAITNFGSIIGGGGAAGSAQRAGSGGAGAVGVNLSGGGNLANAGRVAGGSGGGGIVLVYGGFPAVGGAGGAGGIGANLASGGSVANTGVIVGGAGGNGPVAEQANKGAGNGGIGVKLSGVGIIANSGTIVGGAGGAGDSVQRVAYSAPGQGGAGISLTAGGSVSNTGTIAGGLDPGQGGRFGFPDGAATGVALAGGGSLTNGSPTATAALIEGGIGIQATAASIINYGTILGTNPKPFYRGPGPSYGVRLTSGFIANAPGGLISSASGFGISLGGTAGAATLSNAGTITGPTGIYIYPGFPGGTKSTTIINYGTIAGAVTAINFAVPGLTPGTVGHTLVVIGSNSSLQGVIANLRPGDAFDLPFLPFDDSGTATLVSNGTLSQRLQIVEASGTFTIGLDPRQSFAGDVFQLGSDAKGGTLITEEPVCFCRGTLILTDQGDVPVEKLAVGDRVKTLSGAWKPIVWIGFGRDLVTGRNSLARPIVVRRGALAEAVPSRDLHLTHGHALYFDGVLIPVENLVNHRSILWDERARAVEYYHIELADHDVVFAEGAPAETYYDAANRAFFQNTREGSEAGDEKPACAPVLSSGAVVERVWANLLVRAGGRLECHTTGDPDLHLRVDGKRLDPTTTGDFEYTFALERAPTATLHLCSRCGVLSLLGIDRSDHRRLGVPITQIILWHAGIATCFDHAAPQLREGGCHPAEEGYCWTDGEFALPVRFFAGLSGPVALTVRTKRHHMRYPIPEANAAAA